MVVGRLGGLGDAVDERHCVGEVLELPLADDLVALTPPRAVGEAAFDLLVAQARGHARGR